jgi:hypothetical protein
VAKKSIARIASIARRFCQNNPRSALFGAAASRQSAAFFPGIFRRRLSPESRYTLKLMERPPLKQ